MSSKRYLMTMAPVEAINGKMAQAKVKCQNRVGGNTSGVQYYYGFQKFTNVNRFALRNKSRDLKTDPYNSKEQAHQNKFKAAIKSAADTLADVDMRAAAEARWKKQTKYPTLRGYLIAEYFRTNP